jgi:hypothetical protein
MHLDMQHVGLRSGKCILKRSNIRYVKNKPHSLGAQDSFMHIWYSVEPFIFRLK